MLVKVAPGAFQPLRVTYCLTIANTSVIYVLSMKQLSAVGDYSFYVMKNKAYIKRRNLAYTNWWNLLRH